LAGLPSGYPDNNIDAKQFDYLMLRLQLALLRSEQSFEGLRRRVRDIAGALAEKGAIPMVAERMSLIEELQTDEFWQDVTAPILETVRHRLRDLIKLIEKAGRRPVISDFEDELGEGTAIVLPIGRAEDDFERFKAKARHFLRDRMNELPIQKLRLNLGLTAADLDALDRMLAEAQLGTDGELSKARSEGLGLFVRSLVGLDRQAAMQAFGTFLGGRTLTADQQEFITLVIEELTRTGIMRPDRLFEVPFESASSRCRWALRCRSGQRAHGNA
jgi:type I restriction enzyme R subunit